MGRPRRGARTRPHPGHHDSFQRPVDLLLLPGSDFYFGPVPELPANRQFYRDLSVPTPDRVLLVPILIKGRLIALLYGDNGVGRREEPDIALFRRVAQKASLALEILILRNKIEMI
jgi:hypothetical protein